MRYVGAIFVSGAGLWLLVTIGMLISPPSYADICGDPAAMCCVLCAAIGWFTFVPIFGFPFALIMFLPGHLLVAWIAGRAAWWRPGYWIPGWIVTAVIAAVLFYAALAIADRRFISLNIKNGIPADMVWNFVGFVIGFAVFGLLCGVCYWMMLMRAGRAGGKPGSSRTAQSGRGKRVLPI
jgi:hypothetical protein